MKISRGFRLIIGGLVCLAVTALFIGFWQEPASHDVTRGQLDLFLKARLIQEASLTPTVYQGIYEVEGTYKLSPPASRNILISPPGWKNPRSTASCQQPASKLTCPARATRPRPLTSFPRSSSPGSL